jgi:hypothetical protein
MIRRCLKSLSYLALCVLTVSVVVLQTQPVLAQNAPPAENPQEGAVGIEGKIPSKPPSTAPTITTPSNGAVFTEIPITVSGLCTTGLLVKIFSNNVFVGSVMCEKGSYRLQVDLFSGRNDLVAKVFDAFDQPSPDSNVVSVTFNDSQFNPFGTSPLNLTSNFAQRGANPGQRLVWPIILSGGTGPYAISVDWGDNKAPDLISQQFTGQIDISHIYDNAGIYKVVVKATDKNGLSAYLQLVAVANGAITANTEGESEEDTKIITRILWIPALLSLPLIFVSFWLGRRYELAELRKHIEQHSLDDD